MGYQSKQYNRHGTPIAFVHVSSPKEQEAFLLKKQAEQDAKDLHEELEDIKSLKKELKDTLDKLNK